MKIEAGFTDLEKLMIERFEEWDNEVIVEVNGSEIVYKISNWDDTYEFDSKEALMESIKYDLKEWNVLPKKYTVHVTHVYGTDIEVFANSEEEALADVDQMDIRMGDMNFGDSSYEIIAKEEA